MKRKQNHRGRVAQAARNWHRIVWFAERLNLYHVDPCDITIGCYSDRHEPRFNLVCVYIREFGSFYGHDYRSALKSIRYYIRTGRRLEPAWMRYVDEVSFTDLPTNGAQ